MSVPPSNTACRSSRTRPSFLRTCHSKSAGIRERERGGVRKRSAGSATPNGLRLHKDALNARTIDIVRAWYTSTPHNLCAIGLGSLVRGWTEIHLRCIQPSRCWKMNRIDQSKRESSREGWPRVQCISAAPCGPLCIVLQHLQDPPLSYPRTPATHLGRHAVLYVRSFHDLYPETSDRRAGRRAGGSGEGRDKHDFPRIAHA